MVAKAFQSANKTRSAENSLGNDATLQPQDDAKIATDIIIWLKQFTRKKSQIRILTLNTCDNDTSCNAIYS